MNGTKPTFSAPYGHSYGGILATAMLAVACDGTMVTEGVVRDAAGRAIANARVHQQNHEVLTDGRGCFRLFNVVAPRSHDLPLEIAATGYEPLTAKVEAPGTADVRVTLVRTGGPGQSRLEHGRSGCAKK